MRYSRRQLFLPVLIVIILGGLTACSSGPQVPEPDSEEYQQAVSDFYVSLAASQTSEALFAYNKMTDVAEQYPEEPAAWANLGVYAMRQNNYELASDYLATARDLVPDNADILFLSGLLESREGNIEQSVNYYRGGTALDPDNLKLTFALVTELEREDDTGNADEISELLRQMYESHPDNLAIIYELIRFSAKVGETDLMQSYIEGLVSYSQNWPEELRQQFDRVREMANQGTMSQITLELSFLRNGLDELPSFSEDLNEITFFPNEIGFLISNFLWLPQVEARSAEPDLELTFLQQAPEGIPAGATFVKSVTLLEELPPLAIYVANSEVHIDQSVSFDYPGVENESLLPFHSIAEIDYNFDFRNDLVLAGSGGFKLYRQNDDDTFTDVTANSGLTVEEINNAYYGAWVADLDLDGDLDIILSQEMGSPVIIQNNGDETFARIDLFRNLSGIVDFMWVDLNYDGFSDALFLDQDGNVHLFENFRSAGFTKVENLDTSSGIAAITVADLDGDGRFSVIGLTHESTIQRFEYDVASEAWNANSIVQEPDIIDIDSGSTRLVSADFDNNGKLDLLVSSGDRSRIWLGADQGGYQLLGQNLPGGVYSVVDINGDERLDLLGLSQENIPYQMINSGSMSYNGTTIRARASGTEGDGRINSFGIGGEMEVRSGLLYQKQLITSPNVHFGLGNYSEAQLLRILWPNGSVQAEFAELGMGSTIFNEQILKGSCPWLFTHDGEHMHFVTDILWRSPLGLRINDLETAGVAQTMDRVKIPGHMLRAKDGIYDLRITAELWETHFFDHVSLLAVDHPEGTEIFIDERFAFPVPDLSTHVMYSPEPVARILDDKGNDITAIASEIDQVYVQPFEKTQYQGLADAHYIEVVLGDEAPSEGPLWLVASGWLKPTDSSINLAISQGGYSPPKGLRIEVSDGNGGWIELHNDYGIPAGKLKTILVDLTDVFPESSDRRVRLHTTSEIYWDAIQWAEGMTDDQIVEEALTPVRTELRYRGYSDLNRVDSNSPELPDYSRVSGTIPRWKDLTGHHTRFGDVGELLESIDDRYVIMNAGDEIVLQFSAPDLPPEGWTRSFVFVSDGWEKDGDYNTEASATVLPLPFHGQKNYTFSKNQTLYNDPVYQLHKRDWVQYHTRFITPTSFNDALMFDR